MVRVRSGGKVSDGDFGRACVLGQAMSFILVSSTCLLSVSLGLTAGRYKVTTAVRAPACFTYKTLSVRCTTQFEMCRPVHCSCTGSTENCTPRKMPKQTSQLCVRLPTSADNMTPLAFAAQQRPCRNRPIFPSRRTHSSKPAAEACGGRMMQRTLDSSKTLLRILCEQCQK